MRQPALGAHEWLMESKMPVETEVKEEKGKEDKKKKKRKKKGRK
jgi:hypothetical protein